MNKKEIFKKILKYYLFSRIFLIFLMIVFSFRYEISKYTINILCMGWRTLSNYSWRRIYLWLSLCLLSNHTTTNKVFRKNTIFNIKSSMCSINMLYSLSNRCKTFKIKKSTITSIIFLIITNSYNNNVILYRSNIFIFNNLNILFI